MAFATTKIRAMLWICYFIFAYAVLAFVAFEDPFCVPPRSSPWFIVATRLALYCTFVSALSGMMGHALREWTGSTFFGRLCAITLTFLGLESIVFWIYAGAGVFRFGNSIADVSCLFTEGYGVGFLYMTGPLLTIAAAITEIMIERLQRRTTVPHS